MPAVLLNPAEQRLHGGLIALKRLAEPISGNEQRQ
jgi:hypothetical protein